MRFLFFSSFFSSQKNSHILRLRLNSYRMYSRIWPMFQKKLLLQIPNNSKIDIQILNEKHLSRLLWLNFFCFVLLKMGPFSTVHTVSINI